MKTVSCTSHPNNSKRCMIKSKLWLTKGWSFSNYRKQMRSSRIKSLPITASPNNMQALFMLTSCALSVRSLTLVEEKIALRPWIKHKMQVETSNPKNWSVQDAAKYQWRIVRNTAKILLSSNVNFVVVLPNGFAGEIPISVNHATSGNAMATMWVNIRNNSCRSAWNQKGVLLGANITVTVSRRC